MSSPSRPLFNTVLVALRPRALAIAVAIAASAGCTGPRDSLPQSESATAATAHDPSTGQADSIARARQDSVNRAQPGYIVDSIVAPAEALRRFRADLSPTTALTHGAASRDALVRMWVKALESNDSLTLIRTAMNRPEFAFLIYPSSSSSHPPLYQPPAVLWTQLSNASVQGFRRSLNRLGGHSLGFVSYRCAKGRVREGDNRLWTECLVRRVRAPGDTVEERLFGAIVERRGVFKFYSLANDM